MNKQTSESVQGRERLRVTGIDISLLCYEGILTTFITYFKHIFRVRCLSSINHLQSKDGFKRWSQYIFHLTILL